MLDQLNFLLKSHSSYLPPIFSPIYFSLSLRDCQEVQIYEAAQLLVTTIQPEKVICSVITDTDDREREMDRSPVCVRVSDRENVGVILKVVSA